MFYIFSQKTSQHVAAGKELAQDTLLRTRPGMMSCGRCRFLKWESDEVPKNDDLGVPMGTPHFRKPPYTEFDLG